MIDPIHIPKGHELVKRYSVFNEGPEEDKDGDWVRIEDVKKHLAEWLEGELAKIGPAMGSDFGYKHGYELALRGTLHHVKVIL
jgi:hypothetical protein